MDYLVEVIKEYQRVKGLSDGQFAKLLSIDRSHLSKIKSGERKPGVKVLKGIEGIPEIKESIHSYLTSEEPFLYCHPTIPVKHSEPFSGGLTGKVIRFLKRLIKAV